MHFLVVVDLNIAVQNLAMYGLWPFYLLTTPRQHCQVLSFCHSLSLKTDDLQHVPYFCCVLAATMPGPPGPPGEPGSPVTRNLVRRQKMEFCH